MFNPHTVMIKKAIFEGQAFDPSFMVMVWIELLNLKSMEEVLAPMDERLKRKTVAIMESPEFSKVLLDLSFQMDTNLLDFFDGVLCDLKRDLLAYEDERVFQENLLLDRLCLAPV